jgi:hypothetical protein
MRRRAREWVSVYSGSDGRMLVGVSVRDDLAAPFTHPHFLSRRFRSRKEAQIFRDGVRAGIDWHKQW